MTAAPSPYVTRLRAALERMPQTSRVGEMEAWCRAEFAAALDIEPAAVSVRWNGFRLEVTIPSRLHYAADFDALEQIVADIRLKPADAPGLSDDQFGLVMRGLRGS
jgi:hypothetical protein